MVSQRRSYCAQVRSSIWQVVVAIGDIRGEQGDGKSERVAWRLLFWKRKPSAS